MLVLLIIGIILLALGSIAVVARVARRPIARFLENRDKTLARSVVLDYLEGRTTLNSAAAQLNLIMDRIGWYDHVATPPSAGRPVARVEALSIVPPGYRDDDPRIAELIDRGLYFRLGPDRDRQSQEWLRQQKAGKDSAEHR